MFIVLQSFTWFAECIPRAKERVQTYRTDSQIQENRRMEEDMRILRNKQLSRKSCCPLLLMHMVCELATCEQRISLLYGALEYCMPLLLLLLLRRWHGKQTEKVQNWKGQRWGQDKPFRGCVSLALSKRRLKSDLITLRSTSQKRKQIQNLFNRP